MRTINWARLSEPFAPDEIEWRIGRSGIKGDRVWATCLAYVTNRAVQDRLDEVFGVAGWKNEFRPGPSGGVLCGIAAHDGQEWITKWDGAENTDIEGVKGGLSGAMKRAAVQWGIGRYLYGLEDGFANVHDRGSHRAEAKDRDGKRVPFRWDPPRLPDWALPGARRDAAPKDSPPVAYVPQPPTQEPPPPAEGVDGAMVRALNEECRKRGRKVHYAGEVDNFHVGDLVAYIVDKWDIVTSSPGFAEMCLDALARATPAGGQG